MSMAPERTDGWLAMMPTERPRMRREADDDVHGVAGLDFEEVALIDDAADHVAHVVALLRIDGHELCSARGWDRRCSSEGSRGGSSRLFEGRKLSRRRQR